MPATKPIDPNLLDYCRNDNQRAVIQALIKHGGHQRDAAAELSKKSKSSISETLATIKRQAARKGYAPGHWKDGVAAGYQMGKVTVQRGPTGVERVWERQHPDTEQQRIAIESAIQAMQAEMPRIEPAPPLPDYEESLCAFVTFSDYHLGMLAHREITGEDWNVAIAEQTLYWSFQHLIDAAPPAKKLILNLGGDFLHTDGIKPLTPQHGHLLDADGAYSRSVAAAIRVLRRIINHALTRFSEVVLLALPGNHDLSGMIWIRHGFAAMYEHETRLTVVDCETPYFAVQHGKVMIAAHHGHMRKPDELPLIFAASYPAIWGATTKRYAHCGHRHHVEEKEHAGMKIVQHPTLTANDKYAKDGGWISEREATLIMYHAEFGQVGRTTVTPEMLAA